MLHLGLLKYSFLRVALTWFVIYRDISTLFNVLKVWNKIKTNRICSNLKKAISLTFVELFNGTWRKLLTTSLNIVWLKLECSPKFTSWKKVFQFSDYTQTIKKDAVWNQIQSIHSYVLSQILLKLVGKLHAYCSFNTF